MACQELQQVRGTRGLDGEDVCVYLLVAVYAQASKVYLTDVNPLTMENLRYNASINAEAAVAPEAMEVLKVGCEQSIPLCVRGFTWRHVGVVDRLEQQRDVA